MNEKSIVILCLDDSNSMFFDFHDTIIKKDDFEKAVIAGKEVEKFLKNNPKMNNLLIKQSLKICYLQR